MFGINYLGSNLRWLRTPTATHEDFARENDDLKVPSERSFGITFCVVFAVFRGDFPFGLTETSGLGLLGSSLAVRRSWASGLARQVLGATEQAVVLVRFGLLLHKVMTPLIMGHLVLWADSHPWDC